MANTYKGFWSPTQTYYRGDIVEYYASNSYAGKGRYRVKDNLPDYVTHSIGPITNPNEEAVSCPLKNFSYPVLSQGGSLKSPGQYSPTDADLLIFLGQDDLYQRAGVGWGDYKYYRAEIWAGPNGVLSTSQLNSEYWEDFGGSNTNWEIPSTYDVSGQEFESTSLSTLSTGKYGDVDVSKSVGFDAVQGETDSDAYYLSTVQNYSGYFDRLNSYKKFDIVRDGYSNLFYYARRDVSPHSADVGDSNSSEAIDFADIVIRPPTDYAYSESHVGTIEYVGGGETDFTVDYRVGDLLDFSSANLRAANQKKFNIIGVGPSLIWLGAFESAVEADLMEVESYEADGSFTHKAVAATRYSADIKAYGSCTVAEKNDKASCEEATDINGAKGVWTEHNDSIWSHDKFFFDADYGSTVKFEGKNKQTSYGEGYTSVSPLGVNSLGMSFDLKFTNRSNREANAMLHFLENQLGQHETNKKSYYLDYDQGISGFLLDGDSLFYPYNNPENLTRRFYCFDYSHEIENEDVHTIDCKIMNTTSSTLAVAEQIFVNKAPVWRAEKTYGQHDVVFCPRELSILLLL